MQQRPQNSLVINDEFTVEFFKNNNDTIIVQGICGICNSAHPSYAKAKKCCSALKGKDYEQKLNKVFQV